MRAGFIARLPAMEARETGAWKAIEERTAPVREAALALQARIVCEYELHARALADLLHQAKLLAEHQKSVRSVMVAQRYAGNPGAADVGPAITIYRGVLIPSVDGGPPLFDARRRFGAAALPAGVTAFFDD
jgi:hypothetical protein